MSSPILSRAHIVGRLVSTPVVGQQAFNCGSTADRWTIWYAYHTSIQAIGDMTCQPCRTLLQS